MNGNSNGTPICPCGAFQYPAVIFNPAGLSTITYRVGDYTAFRHALLQALPGESELTENVAGTLVQLWRPSADGDLALQMMEWWAYLADVLTFYNERIANQAYLRTADLPESVNRLIQILGYRPQPGIGATGLLAALAQHHQAVHAAQGISGSEQARSGQAAADLRARRRHSRAAARRGCGPTSQSCRTAVHFVGQYDRAVAARDRRQYQA